MTRRVLAPPGTSVDDVQVRSGSLQLAGTYLAPAGPVGGALVLAASGRVDRNSDLSRLCTGVTAALATTLARAGLATLRYDKRGTGNSEGDYFEAGMTENAEDAWAARDWLARRLEGLPLVAVGYSEGALYAADLAAEGAVDACALFCCPARPVADVLAWQADKLSQALPRRARLLMALARTSPAQQHQERMAELRSLEEQDRRLRGARVNTRWWRQFLEHDPVPILNRVAVPVLALTGGMDTQVPPEDVATIGRLVRGPFQGAVPPTLNHILRSDPTGRGPFGYRRSARRPVSDEATGPLRDWVRQALAGRA